jgi:hypothetical protein
LAGNIHKSKYSKFWKETINPGPFIQDLIENGYTLPFDMIPPESELENNRSALEDRERVEDFLFQYESAGCIYATHIKPHVVLPMSVVFSNKMRLVVDASRNLNPYLRKRAVKLSHLGAANTNLPSDSWMCTLDLESGYHQVFVNPRHRRYLGIAWTRNGIKQYWLWHTLFLGVRDAVYIFSKLLRPHLVLFGSMGIVAVVYIDDLRVIALSMEECARHFATCTQYLKKAGFLIKKGKGIDTPTQRGTFLGLEHDLIDLNYFIPEKKLKDLLDTCAWMQKQRKLKLKTVASFYGKLSACGPALGPSASLLSRAGNALIAVESEISWNRHVKLSDEVYLELKTMHELLPTLNGFPIHQKPSLKPSFKFASDASATGVAALEVVCGDEVTDVKTCMGELVLQRRFSKYEMQQSSTYRELIALWEMYHRRAKRFEREAILHYTDNKAVSIILSRGSGKPILQALALDIFRSCNANKIVLEAQWLPRTDPRMLEPDFFSREHDWDDWGLSQEFLSEMMATLPFRLEIDLFTSIYNARMPRFFSAQYFPESMGVNCFAFDWSKFGAGLCVPPPSSIASAIKHAINCKAKGVLVAPLWRAAEYWINICNDGKHFNEMFIEGVVGHFPLQCAKHLNNAFSGRPSFPMLCLTYDGGKMNPMRSKVSLARCALLGCSLCCN